MVLTIVAGSSINITFVIGLTFAVAASANFPILVLAALQHSGRADRNSLRPDFLARTDRPCYGSNIRRELTLSPVDAARAPLRPARLPWLLAGDSSDSESHKG